MHKHDLCLLLISICLLWVLSTDVSTNDCQAQEGGSTLASSIATVRANVNRLSSAKFSANGNLLVELFRQQGEEVKQSSYLYGVSLSGIISSDRELYKIEMSSEGEAPLSGYGDFREGWLLLTPEFSLRASRSNHSDSADALLEPPQSLFDMSHLYDPIIDIRSAGLTVFDTRKYRYHDVLGIFEKDPGKAESSTTGSLTKWVLFHKSPEMDVPLIKTIVLDSGVGGMPVFISYQYGDSMPFTSVHSQWEFSDGIWVPVNVSFENHSVGKKLTYSLDITWSDIGKKFPDELFHWNEIGLPVGSTIVDGRLGENNLIFVGQIGEDGYRELKDLPVHETSMEYYKIVLLSVNAVIIGAIIGFLLFMRKKKNSL